MNLRTIALVPVFTLALSALPSAAWAEPPTPSTTDTSGPEDARAHFADGLKLYKDGDFDAALVQFERAYAIKPNFKVLYNIAQAYFQLREYVEARDNMARYLKDGGAAIDPERQAAASKDLADLEKRVAKVTLTVNVAGATVLVDGKKVGTTPLSEPISVSEGQRTISVEAPNRGARQRLIRVAGGEEQALSLDFEVAPPPVATGPQNAPPELGPSKGLGPVFWSTAVGAVALGAGAGITGFLALKANDDNKNQRQQFGVSPTTIDDSRSRTKTLALTSDILSGAALVCAGVAVVILITHHSDSPQLVGSF